MYGNYSKHHANQAYDIDFIRHSQGKRLMYRVVLIDLLNNDKKQVINTNPLPIFNPELNITAFTIKYLIIIFIIFNVKYDY